MLFVTALVLPLVGCCTRALLCQHAGYCNDFVWKFAELAFAERVGVFGTHSSCTPSLVQAGKFLFVVSRSRAGYRRRLRNNCYMLEQCNASHLHARYVIKFNNATPCTQVALLTSKDLNPSLCNSSVMLI